MKMPSNILLVSELAGKQACVKISAPTPAQLQKCLDLGFEPQPGKLVRVVVGEEDRLALTKKLIEAGALFIGGPGWSPAEVVAQYKDEGKINQAYRAIVWKSPEEYEIRDVA